MPKARARKRSAIGSQRSQTGQSAQQATPAAGRRRVNAAAGKAGQGLVMSVLVAIGCWGLAVSFTFFSNEPNHYLFGGMAALMALIWSIIFVLRLRRTLRK